jgi:hypothetical protein
MRSSQSGLTGNVRRQINSPISKLKVTLNPRRLGRRVERGHVVDGFIVRKLPSAPLLDVATQARPT